MQLTDHLVPLRRPHFHLQGRQLFFLVSKRPHTEFDAVDAALWGRLDGQTPISRLREQIPDALERIQKFWDRGIVEAAQARFPAERKRVLVVEPHMDDAILSVGGVMWQQREACEFTVLSVVGVSNFTSYHRLDREYFDVATVSRLRRDESETIMRLLGGHHRVLDQHDAPLRYQPGLWTRPWYVKHRRSISAFINHSSPDAEVESLVARLIPVLAATDAQEIWIPLGVGTSADHEMTRNACLWALQRLPEPTRRAELFFYQDVPYAKQFPWHTAQILDAAAAAGGVVEPVCVDIGEAMPAKLRLLSVFGSQFKPSYMDPKVIATAHQAMSSDTRQGELIFRIKRLPGPTGQLPYYSGRGPIEELLPRLASWYPRHRAAERIRILCPMGVGRWQQDLSCLLEAFPATIFEVHLTRDAVEETTRLVSPRIDVRPVEGLKLAWILRILRVLFSRPRPLIVLTSAKLRKITPLVRAACFLAGVLPATNFDHLVQALRIRISPSDPGGVDRGG